MIGLKKQKIEMLNSKFQGFPTGFEHFGPRIRIPRANTEYIAGWKRLETLNLVNKSQTLVWKEQKN